MNLPLTDMGAAFALALLGAVHCAGMCGGFVAAIQFNRAPQLSAGQLSFGYHVGRLTSYTAGGALIGALGGGLYASGVRPVQVLLLGAAGIALVAIGVMMMGHAKLLKRLEPLGVWLWRSIAPVARYVVPPRRLWHAWLAGVVWGWIPCGMVYAALPLALASGGSANGALVMIAFGLGTLPGMLATDIGVAKLAIESAGGAPRRPVLSSALARLRPGVGAVIVVFGVSSLAHATHVAGLDHPAIALLASICGR